MLSLIKPLVSHDIYAVANGIIWAKTHIASHFDDLDLLNRMVSIVTLTLVSVVLHDPKGMLHCFLIIITESGVLPLMMPLASHDRDAGVNGLTWPQKSCCSHCDHLNLTDGIVPLITLLASCNTGTSISSIKWPNSYVAHSFSCLDLMNTVVLLTVPLATHADANSKCQMTEKVML